MNDNNNSNSNGNWLGFSLSPQMSMEVSADSHPPSEAVNVSSALPNNYFVSPHLNGSGIYYGVEGGNTSGYYSQLSVMPLKSDGSLCIMEALSRSQQQEGTQHHS